MTSEGEIALNVLAGFARTIVLLPLDEVLDDVERAQAIGPILEPTAYVRGADNLRDQIELLQGAIAFRDAAQRIIDRARPTIRDVRRPGE